MRKHATCLFAALIAAAPAAETDKPLRKEKLQIVFCFGNVYAFLDQKAEEEGIYRKIAAILDSDENCFDVDQACAEMIGREALIAGNVRRVREIYLNGTTAEDFGTFEAAVKEAGIKTNDKGPDCERIRALCAGLAQKHLNLPIAKRTRIDDPS